MAISRTVIKFQVKMREKDWNLEYNQKERRFVDPVVQEFFEVFNEGFRSAPSFSDCFYIVARITEEGLQFGSNPYIQASYKRAKIQMIHLTRKFGDGFIAMAGRDSDLKELEAKLGYKLREVPRNKSKQKQQVLLPRSAD